MVRMLSFSSYFLAKNPDRQDFFAVVLTVAVSVLTTGFSAVLDLVETVLSDLFDDFDFLVAIYFPPLMIIRFIIAHFLCYNGKNNLFRKNMGVIVNKEDDKNNELAKRINADLRARAVAEADRGDDPDFAEDSEYLKNTQKTGRFGWVWLVLIVLAIISMISIVFI